MRIQPIVEGHGEVEAIPVLLRRLCEEAGALGIEIGRPIRQSRSQLVQEATLRRAVQLARLQPHCRAILVVLDSDDDCPMKIAPRLEAWVCEEAAGVPCAVVMARQEYEAWFLASMESLRGIRGIRDDAISPDAPESIRGAKEHLGTCLRPGRFYSPAADQAALTAKFSLAVAYNGCRSFKRMASAFALLVRGMNLGLPQWPPPSWSSVSP